jgi:hypothetical protein
MLPRGQKGPHSNLSPATEVEELCFRIAQDLCVHGWSCTALGEPDSGLSITSQALALTGAIWKSTVGVPNERTERAQTAGR